MHLRARTQLPFKPDPGSVLPLQEISLTRAKYNLSLLVRSLRELLVETNVFCSPFESISSKDRTKPGPLFTNNNF